VQNALSLRTAEQIGKEYGVSKDTVKRDEQFSKSVDKVAEEVGKEAAKEWIYRNQLGRRNLTEQEASYYRGKLYETRKQSHGGDRNSSANFLHLKTADVIGKEYGKTINEERERI